jgi:hypothetical protein
MQYDRTSYLEALEGLMREINDSFPQLKTPVEAYICGGAAVMFWVESARISMDVDAFFSHTFVPPQNLQTTFEDLEGEPLVLDFDYNFNQNFSLLHPDYAADAHCIKEFSNLKVTVLSPQDVAVMKLSRFTQGDREDIKALITAGCLDDAEQFRKRAMEALDYYVGKPDFILYAINDVCGWIEDARPSFSPE